MNESIKTRLAAVVRTLNSITVNGRNNLDMLLACIMMIEQLINEEERRDPEDGVLDSH